MKVENLKNLAGIIAFYLIVILGIIAINSRMEYINNSSSSIMESYQQ